MFIEPLLDILDESLGMALRGLAASALFLIALFPLPSAAQPESATGNIATGATITLQNWPAYRQFMSDGLVALFEGKHFWRMPADLQIEVGPARSIPLPQKYLEDTERYSRQVRLVRMPSGGYVPSGYVAGLPFPKPLEGDPALRGQRIFWDSYYRYQPRVQWAPTFTYTLDKFGNMTQASEVKKHHQLTGRASDRRRQCRGRDDHERWDRCCHAESRNGICKGGHSGKRRRAGDRRYAEA